MYSSVVRFGAVLFSVLLAHGCGGGGGNVAPNVPGLLVSGAPGNDGVFDSAPASDLSGALWMSYSNVNWSPVDPPLSQVHTRIALSQDNGATWADAGSGIDPNQPPADFQVGGRWVTWRFEVSRLFYDPYDNIDRRWKMLWHRVAAVGSPTPMPLYQNSWIGYSSAATPDGNWSAERKLFTGSAYNSQDMDAAIGPPEFPLDSLFNAGLGGCALFTEPGVLARSDSIYVSLQCSSEDTAANKIVLLRCDRAFSACRYLGDLLTAADAPQFSLDGESVDFFGASELVDTAAATYLIVTGADESVPGGETRYSGCLVFRVSDLATAAVERSAGKPILVTRVEGTSGSFNGACGYDARASASGIIYSEATVGSPRFHLFASHITLP